VPTVQSPGRRGFIAAAGATALAGCGFKLREPAQLPFTRLAISGFRPASPMADALRQALPRTVTVVAQPKDAEVVLVVVEDRFDKTVAASTAAGQVREFRLRVTLRFRLDRPDGSPQLAEQQLELVRDMSYSERPRSRNRRKPAWCATCDGTWPTSCADAGATGTSAPRHPRRPGAERGRTAMQVRADQLATQLRAVA
jgi:LPS-assembly lipoprotein